MTELNNNLQRLIEITRKPERLGIGLMSGTSLDGLDIALCKFRGSSMQTSFELLNFTTVNYDDSFKTDILELFAQKQVSLEKLCLMNDYVGTFHAELILNALKQWGITPDEVDFIASHGQTIYHAPKRLHLQERYPNATLQIGDGDHIAVKTGIITISDFRQKHIAAGGEGAPLALYGDVILGSKPDENRILLNIGGIANLTWLPGNGNAAEVVCTDLGPGNTLIDAACRRYFNKAYDKDAELAFGGTVNEDLLKALLSHSFFTEAAPKTTGPELFSLDFAAHAQQASGTENISPTDLISTLSQFTAQSIADFVKANFGDAPDKIYVSGGGARNPYVVGQLKKLLAPAAMLNTEDLGIDPDAKEAILFALLGNEALCGQALHIGANPAVLMGKFSFPG